MPVGSVFKHNNSQPITFAKTSSWKLIPNFELNVSYNSPKEFFFFIFYNISLKLEAKYTFSTRLVLENKPRLVNFLFIN